MKTRLLLLILLLLNQIEIFGQLPNIKESYQLKNTSSTNPTNPTIKINKENYIKLFKVEENKRNEIQNETIVNLDVVLDKVDKDTKLESIGKVEGDTATSFLYRYHKNNQIKIAQDIKNLKQQSNQSGLTLAELLVLQNKIQQKKDILDKYDTLFEKTRSNERFNKSFPTFKKKDKDRFFTSLYSKSVDNDFYFVNNASMQFNNEGSTIQSELISAYLGPTRITFGTMLSNSGSNDTDAASRALSETAEGDSSSTTSSEAFQRLLNNAGNIYMGFELPAFYYQTKQSTVYSNIYTKGAADIAEFSNDVDTATANFSLGTNLYASISSDRSEFTFFVNATFALYAGGKEFFQRLEVEDEKPFSFGQVSFGFTVMNSLRLSFTTNTFGSEENLRSGKVVFGVQLLSGLFDGK